MKQEELVSRMLPKVTEDSKGISFLIVSRNGWKLMSNGLEQNDVVGLETCRSIILNGYAAWRKAHTWIALEVMKKLGLPELFERLIPKTHEKIRWSTLA